MNLIIAKSINFYILYLALFKAPCEIHYLEPVGNNLFKVYMKTLNKLIDIRFKRVKMGRISNKSNIRLNKIAINLAAKRVKKIRQNLYQNSCYEIVNILNEDYIRKIWYEYIAYELLIIYSKEIKLNLKKSSKIIFIQKIKTNIFQKIFKKFNNFISIETLRLISYFSFSLEKIFTNKFKNSSEYQFVENVVLGSEPFPETMKEECFRNQKTISKNILNSENFLIIDVPLKIFYYFNKKFKIINGPIFEFLSKFVGLLPSLSEYSRINYNLNIISIFRTLKISFLIWSVSRKIKTKQFIMRDNSNYGSGFLIVSKLKNVPAYIYQFSLLNQMNPYLHNPMAGIMGFTQCHIKMFLNESHLIKGSVNYSKMIKYPFAANISKKRVDNLKNFLSNNFDLSIGFFDESYCRDNIKIDAIGAFFYEDALYEIKTLLLIARKNPKIAIVFKSQFVAKSLKNYILNDPYLKTIFDPKQIFDIVVPTSYNDRNIVVPEEISKSVDLSINLLSGGTAGYEALASKCRTVFIRSGFSVYDEVIPKNLLIKSIDDFEDLLKSINFNRRDLLKTNIGKANINLISRS